MIKLALFALISIIVICTFFKNFPQWSSSFHTYLHSEYHKTFGGDNPFDAKWTKWLAAWLVGFWSLMVLIVVYSLIFAE